MGGIDHAEFEGEVEAEVNIERLRFLCKGHSSRRKRDCSNRGRCAIPKTYLIDIRADEGVG